MRNLEVFNLLDSVGTDWEIISTPCFTTDGSDNGNKEVSVVTVKVDSPQSFLEWIGDNYNIYGIEKIFFYDVSHRMTSEGESLYIRHYVLLKNGGINGN